MQVPAPVEYERATSVDHAITLLERLGGSARILVGFPTLRSELDHLVTVVSTWQ
jgi:hypothetical protein